MINAMRYTRVLEESGFSKEQASTALNVVLELMNDNFASPKDIQLSEQSVRSALSSSQFELRREIGELRDELRADIKDIRSDMILMENRVISKLTKNAVLIAGLIVTVQTIILRL